MIIYQWKNAINIYEIIMKQWNIKITIQYIRKQNTNSETRKITINKRNRNIKPRVCHSIIMYDNNDSFDFVQNKSVSTYSIQLI